MNSAGTRKAYRIKQNEKFSGTAPETAFADLCKANGITAIAQFTLPPLVSFGETYSITADFRIGSSEVLVEVDGTYHTTKIQIRKSSWRDDLLVQSGYRVFHCESELLVCHNLGDSKRFWSYVLKALNEFIVSNEEVRYLKA